MANPSAAVNPLEQCTEEELRRRGGLKWNAHPPDVLPLWVAEMDVPLADCVTAALRQAVERGRTGYPGDAGDYAAALAGFARDRWGWALPTGRATAVPDVMRGIVAVLQAVTAPGDAVVVSPPVYPPFARFAALAGRRVLPAPLGPAHRLDVHALEDAFTEATRGGRPAVYLLCSPHNPTGTVHTAAELTELAALARAHRVRVVADEIHAPLVLPGARHVPYLSLPGTGADFALLSAAKAWNVSGLGTALLVRGAECADLPPEAAHGTGTLGLVAQTAALRSGGAWLDALLRGLDANRRLLGDLLADRLPGVRCQAPQGTYLAWLDCRRTGLGADPAAVLLERARVALTSGTPFGPGGEGHARLNFAASARTLTRAVEAMAGAAGSA
jgi:cystathionine beta-lyase